MKTYKHVASWSNTLPTLTSFCDFKEGQHILEQEPFIPRGAGRSFGDISYTTHGTSLLSRSLTHLEPVNQQFGTITLEAGVQLIDLHRHVEHTDFTFPIYGGTQWATIGGAVACDIHGKNQATAGSFGNHVEAIRLVTPRYGEIECSRIIRSDLFAATIGGAGLTGFIKSVILRLSPAHSRSVLVRARRVATIAESLACFDTLPGDFQFCSWLNPTQPGSRGIYFYAHYSETDSAPEPRMPLPFPLPRLNLFNPLTMRAIDVAFHALVGKQEKLIHIRDFNYSGVHEVLPTWCRLFGRPGMIEYQFTLPAEAFRIACHELLTRCQRQARPIYFAVIKRFGNLPVAGLLSFPLAGYTMSFQMGNSSANRQFLTAFTDILLELGGRVYLAKDSCIKAHQFSPMYPQLERWRRIVQDVDPENRINSDLATRLELKNWGCVAKNGRVRSSLASPKG